MTPPSPPGRVPDEEQAAGWTAGPLVVHRQPREFMCDGDAEFSIQAEAGGVVALINLGTGTRADLQLWAAAPALHAALVEVSDMLLARPDMVAKLWPLMGPAERAIFERARAALASAVFHD